MSSCDLKSKRRLIFQWLSEWVSYAIKTRDAYASTNLCLIAKNTLYLLFRDKNNVIFVKICLTVPVLTGCAWEPGSRFPLFVEVCWLAILRLKLRMKTSQRQICLVSPFPQLLSWAYWDENIAYLMIVIQLLFIGENLYWWVLIIGHTMEDIVSFPYFSQIIPLFDPANFDTNLSKGVEDF